jgi:hypothetical protein
MMRNNLILNLNTNGTTHLNGSGFSELDSEYHLRNKEKFSIEGAINELYLYSYSKDELTSKQKNLLSRINLFKRQVKSLSSLYNTLKPELSNPQEWKL